MTWVPSGDGFSKVAAGPATFTSWVTGPTGQSQTDPSALNIEFDCVVYPFDQAQGGTKITVWGVGLGMISQAANLNGSSFTLEAGMKPGLPLATAAFSAGQTGVVLQGTVFQAYGNWQGVNQTLELICNPGIANAAQKINWNWPKGQSLVNALNQTFAASFSGYTPRVNISANLTPPVDQHGTYYSLSTLASYLQPYTQMLGQQQYGSSYPGVRIVINNGNIISAYDGQGTTYAPVVKTLQFQDFIGQPTWLQATVISFKTVLRNDISLGMQVLFPPGIGTPYVLTGQGSAYPNTPAANKLVFGNGRFVVTEVHHFANFRQPDGDSWATAFTAAFLQ